MRDYTPCVRCGSRVNIQKHHVVYSDLPVHVCFNCHRQITLINTVVARLYNGKLNDEMRKRIWKIFVDMIQESWFQNSILRILPSQGERLEI